MVVKDIVSFSGIGVALLAAAAGWGENRAQISHLRDAAPVQQQLVERQARIDERTKSNQADLQEIKEQQRQTLQILLQIQAR